MNNLPRLGLIALVVAVLAGGAYLLTSSKPASEPETVSVPNGGSPADAPAPSPVTPEAPEAAAAVKEFTMTAFYDEKGKWFSVKEMAVTKGDRVKITVTNTKGMHDFTLDEYGIKNELPLNEPVVIEFTADKAGSFVYYCSKPGHRAGGQWGTLTVSE